MRRTWHPGCALRKGDHRGQVRCFSWFVFSLTTQAASQTSLGAAEAQRQKQQESFEAEVKEMKAQLARTPAGYACFTARVVRSRSLE